MSSPNPKRELISLLHAAEVDKVFSYGQAYSYGYAFSAGFDVQLTRLPDSFPHSSNSNSGQSSRVHLNQPVDWYSFSFILDFNEDKTIGAGDTDFGYQTSEWR